VTRPSTPTEATPEVDAARSRHTAGAVSLDEFLAEESDDTMWALPGLIARGGFIVCVGAPESFKTFGGFTVELAFSGAIPDFLGIIPAERMPVLYVSNEKSRAMVRARLGRMTAGGRMPTEPFGVLHRKGVQFGSPSWDRVTDALRDFGRRALVHLDTEASLSRPGFDENSGRDTGIVLDCIRQMQAEYEATVILNVHPSKYAQGAAGAKVRGHTSLWGEADAIWEYQRPNRTDESGMLVADVKDGDRLVIPFRWNRDTFLLQPGERLALTTTTVAAVVRALWQGEPLASEAIVRRFAPSHKRTAVLNKLAEAVKDGLVGLTGNGKSTRYHPVDETNMADEPTSEHLRSETDA
jgi:AAA domain